MPLARSPVEKCASDSEARNTRKLKRPREEPWQTDLKSFKDEMLKAINALRSDMSVRFTLMDSKLDKLSDIEKSLEFLSTRYEELSQNISDIQVKMIQYDEHINRLEGHIEDLSRNALASHIEIRNVPKLEKETKNDLNNYIQNLSNVLLSESTNVHSVYRWGTKKEGHSSIIVELTSLQAKLNLLKAAKLHNKNYPLNRLTASHLGIKENNSTPIFIGEQLTNKNRRLFFLGRRLIKDGTFKFCWTSNGKVYLRKCESSSPILLKTEEQIEQLRAQPPHAK